MSNENGGVAGSDDHTGDTTRVGNAERDAAVALLAEHWHAGRLDPAEHELRVTKAGVAVTQADLDALFADLPQSGPAHDTTTAAPVGGTQGFLEGKRDTIIALTPFAALALFFGTGHWEWFLMVPVIGILLYGPDGKKRSRQRGS